MPSFKESQFSRTTLRNTHYFTRNHLRTTPFTLPKSLHFIRVEMTHCKFIITQFVRFQCITATQGSGWPLRNIFCLLSPHQLENRSTSSVGCRKVSKMPSKPRGHTRVCKRTFSDNEVPRNKKKKDNRPSCSCTSQYSMPTAVELSTSWASFFNVITVQSAAHTFFIHNKDTYSSTSLYVNWAIVFLVTCILKVCAARYGVFLTG